jgi:hypothetical protein
MWFDKNERDKKKTENLNALEHIWYKFLQMYLSKIFDAT